MFPCLSLEGKTPWIGEQGHRPNHMLFWKRYGAGIGGGSAVLCGKVSWDPGAEGELVGSMELIPSVCLAAQSQRALSCRAVGLPQG